MIVRQFCARQGRRLLSGPSSRVAFRSLTTEVESVEQAVQNSLKQTHSIEASVNRQSSTHVASIDNTANPTPAPQTPASRADSQKQYETLQSRQKSFKNIGSLVTNSYEPHTVISNPPKPSDITLELLLASQSHLGHATSLWNSRNAKYIFGVRDGIHIISLDVTAAYLRRACKVVEEVAKRGGLILFVGTRDGQERCIVNAAKLAKGYHIFERWTPGSLTNGQQILGHCKMKVVDYYDNEVPGFDEQLASKPVRKPDLVVCLNPLENEVMLHECGLHNVPTIGIIDTDADPTWVTYPIPANDDSLRCTQVIAGVLGRAGQAGQKQRAELVQRKQRPFPQIKPDDIYGTYSA